MPIPYRTLSDYTLSLLADSGDTQALMELGHRAERLGILAGLRELAKRLRETSDIYGEGYGSAHNWRHCWSSPSKTSYYQCARCGHKFVHAYDSTPNIFEAMEQQGVPAECCENSKDEKNA